MKVRSEIVDGKRKIIFIKNTAEIDKDRVREAMQVVLKDKYELDRH